MREGTSLKPISRLGLAEQVAGQLCDMISTGKWKAGDKLPSESDLCTTLNIGRSTLREAMRSLAFTGLLRTRPGEGTYVSDDHSRFMERVVSSGLLRTNEQIADLCEARMTLETELAALAAERATSADIENMSRLVEIQRDVKLSKQDFAELDLQLHMAIAESSKNAVLGQLLRTIRGLLQEYIVKSQRMPAARDLAISGHAAILEAIRRRQPEMARQAMRNHLQGSGTLVHRITKSMNKIGAAAQEAGGPAK